MIHDDHGDAPNSLSPGIGSGLMRDEYGERAHEMPFPAPSKQAYETSYDLPRPRSIDRAAEPTSEAWHQWREDLYWRLFHEDQASRSRLFETPFR